MLAYNVIDVHGVKHVGGVLTVVQANDVSDMEEGTKFSLVSILRSHDAELQKANVVWLYDPNYEKGCICKPVDGGWMSIYNPTSDVLSEPENDVNRDLWETSMNNIIAGKAQSDGGPVGRIEIPNSAVLNESIVMQIPTDKIVPIGSDFVMDFAADSVTVKRGVVLLICSKSDNDVYCTYQGYGIWRAMYNVARIVDVPPATKSFDASVRHVISPNTISINIRGEVEVATRRNVLVGDSITFDTTDSLIKTSEGELVLFITPRQERLLCTYDQRGIWNTSQYVETPEPKVAREKRRVIPVYRSASRSDVKEYMLPNYITLQVADSIEIDTLEAITDSTIWLTNEKVQTRWLVSQVGRTGWLVNQQAIIEPEATVVNRLQNWLDENSSKMSSAVADVLQSGSDWLTDKDILDARADDGLIGYTVTLRTTSDMLPEVYGTRWNKEVDRTVITGDSDISDGVDLGVFESGNYSAMPRVFGIPSHKIAVSKNWAKKEATIIMDM